MGRAAKDMAKGAAQLAATAWTLLREMHHPSLGDHRWDRPEGAWLVGRQEAVTVIHERWLFPGPMQVLADGSDDEA